jgi:hypothetical protein
VFCAGLSFVTQKLLTWDGFLTFLYVFYSFTLSIRMGFLIREKELERGITEFQDM